MLSTTSALIAGLALTLAAIGASPSKQEAQVSSNVLRFKMKDIDGKEVDLSSFKGKVVVIVNVASKCGYTKQYADLQALHDKYGEQGLVILGFPANEFGDQEPGTDAEIKTFCTDTYSVKFPMFSKVVVKGDGQCDLYKHLTSSETNPKFAGEIKWNFTKFLIARDGTIVNRFEPKVKPTSEEMTKAIEAELARN